MRQGLRAFPLIVAVFVAIGTLAGLTAALKRFHIEMRNRRIELALEWDEVARLAQTSGQPVGETLARFKAQGVSTLVLQEDTIAALEQTGAVRPVRVGQGAVAGTVAVLDSVATLRRIQAALKARHIPTYPNAEVEASPPPGGTTFLVPDAPAAPNADLSLALPLTSKNYDKALLSYGNVRTLGLGLPQEGLAAAKAANLRIAGRIGNFPGVSVASATDVLRDLKAQGASIVIFTGEEVLGYRGLEKQIAALFREPGASAAVPDPPPSLDLLYGAVEFGKQKGDEKLAAALHGDYVRVHSIQAAEMGQMEESEAIERFVKAARERNIRFCYVRLLTFAGDDPVGVNVAFLGKIKQGMQRGSGLTGGGLGFGAAKRYAETAVPSALFLLMALGTAGGATWVVHLFCPLPERAKYALLVALSLLCVGMTAGLGETGRKFVALLAGIAFPTLACLSLFPTERILALHRNNRQKCLFAALLALFAASLITGIGIAHVIGLLATRPFMLRANQFLGIKAQHAVPLLIVAVAVVLGGVALSGETWEQYRVRALRHFRAAYNEPARFGLLLLGLVALAGLAIVVARTGNESGVGVSGFELKFRAILDRILPVRPRTKEFLVGHPAFVLGIAWWLRGRRQLAMPCFVVGSLGQVSLLNTFCHIHTPLIVSAWRDVIGLILGALLGIGVFLLVELSLKQPESVTSSTALSYQEAEPLETGQPETTGKTAPTLTEA